MEVSTQFSKCTRRGCRWDYPAVVHRFIYSSCSFASHLPEECHRHSAVYCPSGSRPRVKSFLPFLARKSTFFSRPLGSTESRDLQSLTHLCFNPWVHPGLGHCFEEIKRISSVIGSTHVKTEGLKKRTSLITQYKARAEKRISSKDGEGWVVRGPKQRSRSWTNSSCCPNTCLWSLWY